MDLKGPDFSDSRDPMISMVNVLFMYDTHRYTSSLDRCDIN